MIRKNHRVIPALALLVFGRLALGPDVRAEGSYPDRVEIRRTLYGVPHILADDLGAAFFGLAYCHLEDYGERTVKGLVEARGEMSRIFGSEFVESDLTARLSHQAAVEGYHSLDQDIRDVFEGYAAGVNYYVQLHRKEFEGWPVAPFTGHDVAALWVEGHNRVLARDFNRKLDALEEDTSPMSQGEDGSNAWALAPTRTASGHAILVRNPHLNWNAAYYEAHVTVPGSINFYGDLRVGFPLYFNGGFNENLGWATTNNYADLDEIYALDVDTQAVDHYLFDGSSLPLIKRTVTVEVKNGPGLSSESRDFWFTAIGPVIRRGEGKIYVMRSGGEGETRGPLQFLRMMQAENFEQWTAAMKMRAQRVSNFTYADRQGNIFYLWNATIPKLPHDSVGELDAVPVSNSSQIWTHIADFESLPQLLNPPGGYLQNANDSFHYTNLENLMDPAGFPPNFSEPRLRLRSQLSLRLIQGQEKLSLEEVIRRKHDRTMLLAERLKNDLIKAVRESGPAGEVAAAADLLVAWDNSVSAESRGGVLFQTWFERYLLGDNPDGADVERAWERAFREPWNRDRPTSTPIGLADPKRATTAFSWAVGQTRKLYGGWDVTWGEVYRIRRGKIDIPAGGCPGDLGCFRVLWFNEAEDGKQVVSGGDGWVLAVEFGDPIQAYSVLAYGQSSREESPHFSDQLEMFERGQLKKVAFSEGEIEAQLIRKYRPGEELTEQ